MFATRLIKLSRASLAGVVLLITVGLLLSVTQARAETVKGRDVFHWIKGESIEVGDEPGHVLVVAEYKGLAFFENGEIATASETETYEETKGSGTFQGYTLWTFEDESTQFVKWQGTFTMAIKGKPVLIKGIYAYVRGSGRFAGIQGSGSFSGKIFPGFAGYWDFTGTYTLPKK